MNVYNFLQKFPDQQSCIDYLESTRWPEHTSCPFCKTLRVARKKDGSLSGRWNCHSCRSSFSVLSGTIFSGSRIPLQKWFLAIILMSDAKKSLSSYQLARHLDMNQKSAYNVQQKIRQAPKRPTWGFRLPGAAVTAYLTNGASGLQAELSHGQLDESVFIGLQTLPLDQQVERGHGKAEVG